MGGPVADHAKLWSALAAAASSDLGVFHRLVHPRVSAEPYLLVKHVRAMAYALNRVATGETRRLLIAVPPRFFKSAMASVALPAFLLGRDPTLRIVCASYGMDLATTFGRETMQVMRSPEYLRLFPATRLSAKAPAADTLRTTKTGYRIATSIGGVLTGVGADVAIIDDPLKAADASSALERERVSEWFRTSLMTRFDKPAEARVVVLMQRLHQQDLIGVLKADPAWEILELPAETITPYALRVGPGQAIKMEAGDLLFPERFGLPELAVKRHDLGEAGYNAQMLQRPSPAGGAVFKLNKIKRFDLPQEALWLKSYDRLIMSIDAASVASGLADYTAVTWWGFKGPQVHLLNALQGRWELPTLLERTRKWRKGVDGILIERGGCGFSLFHMLRQNGDVNIWEWNPKVAKAQRAEHAYLLMEQGHVRLPHAAHWKDEVEAQLAEFPQGKHDDYVDSISQVPWNLTQIRARLHLPHISLSAVA